MISKIAQIIISNLYRKGEQMATGKTMGDIFRTMRTRELKHRKIGRNERRLLRATGRRAVWEKRKEQIKGGATQPDGFNTLRGAK